MTFSDKLSYGKEAEAALAKALKAQGLEVMSCQEYFGDRWSPKIDAEYGDLHVRNSEGREVWIDVKRDMNKPYTPGKKFYGTITKTPQSEPFRAKDNSWYALTNIDMDDWKFVKASELRDSSNVSMGHNGTLFWKTDTIKSLFMDGFIFN